MTTPNIAVNDAWGTMISGGTSAANELMPEAGNDFLSVMDKTVKGQQPKAAEAVQAGIKTDSSGRTQKAKPENRTPEKKTDNTDNSTGRESREAKVQGREAKKTSETTSKTEVKDEVKEAVASKAEEVKIAIIEELGITAEELEKAMEILNIGTLDLLDPQTVPELVSKISGQDISAVLTDEALYTSVNDISGMIRQKVSELMQSIDQTGEEFTQTLRMIKEEPEILTESPEDQESLNEGQIPPENEKGFEKVKIEIESSQKDVVRTPAEADPEKKTAADVTERKSVTGEQDDAGQSDMFTERTDGQSRTRQDTRGERHQTDPGNDNTNTFVQNLTQSVNDVIAGSDRPDTFADPYVRAEQILDQIENSIKVGFHNDETSMEMQLHPASLGKINVKIVSANGEVTAQFEAQNASVKAALEGHVAQLKNTLQEQGVRIENVEVTLASHEFEQNLMQGQDQNAGNTEGRKGTRMRRINLNDDEDESLSLEGTSENEAERIARSMMAANGTSVDYQA